MSYTRAHHGASEELKVNVFVRDKLRGRGAKFFLRAEPSGSEGGLSEEMKNREGEAPGHATGTCILMM